MRNYGLAVILMVSAPYARALPPSDFFEPDMTMYSFADLWVVRPLTAAILPLTATTFAAGAPVAVGSGKEALERSYNVLVSDPAEFLASRPLGSFFDWENRDQTRPVVIKFSETFAVAELSPSQEQRYRAALKSHEARMEAIQKEAGLPESERERLIEGEEKRWEDLVRRLLSM